MDAHEAGYVQPLMEALMRIIIMLFLFCLLSILRHSGQVNQAQEPWEEAEEAIQEWNRKYERR